MRSFMIIAESTTIMGVVTIMTDAEIGEVRLIHKKVSILKATPKKAAAIIRGKSFMAIFSFGITTRKSKQQRSAYAQWIK
jgi:hypothetical protein